MASRIATDVKLLRKALKIGSFLGIVPPISTQRPVIWYVYHVLLGVIFLIWHIVLIIYYEGYNSSTMSATDEILDYMDVIILISFNIIYFKTSLSQRERLEKLLKNLSRMARLLTTGVSDTTSDNRLFYFLVSLTSALWVLVAFFSYLDVSYLGWYVSLSMCDTYSAIWIYCLHGICSVIRSSFISSKRFIEEHFPTTSPEGNFRTPIATLGTRERSAAFKLIVEVNCLIDDSVRITNSIFGGMILVLFGKVFFNVMNALNYQLYLVNEDSPPEENLMELPNIFQSVLSLALSIIVIRVCDDVQKAHVQLITTCRRQLAHMEDKFLFKELFVLSTYVENLPPKFTAAGFFRITRELLSSFSSTLIAYLIVTLQFKMASKR